MIICVERGHCCDYMCGEVNIVVIICVEKWTLLCLYVWKSEHYCAYMCGKVDIVVIGEVDIVVNICVEKW